jgi:hypothetical protein
MMKWFAYIVLLFLFAPCLSLAKKLSANNHHFLFYNHNLPPFTLGPTVTDTVTKKNKQQQEDEKKKIKEIARAKRQQKPEKVEEQNTQGVKAKPKRQHRPEGLERPPEIPRRNGN